MPATVSASAQATIDVAPDRAVAALTDYRGARSRMLTESYSNWRVEEGGVGTGTVFSYRFKAGPRERDYRMRCEQADASSILERDLGSSLTTRWLVTPEADGRSAVAVETSWQGAGGVGGFFERTFAPRALRRIYATQLARLEAAAAG